MTAAPLQMGKKLASIDLGTHTARLLVAEWDENAGGIVPLMRDRRYVYLGSALEREGGKKVLSPGARHGVVAALQAFKRYVQGHRAKTTMAVATGVMREAQNGEEFLQVLREETGIDIRLVSGEEEARLTASAVHHVIDVGTRPHVVVDLGGGSTEFAVTDKNQWWIRSISMGASILTEMYLNQDPPGREELKSLRRFVRDCIANQLDPMPFQQVFSMVGTGGTLVTLGAVLHGIPLTGLDPGLVNGLEITRKSIQGLLKEMSTMNRQERVRHYGLDEGRADVLPAGVLVAEEIMAFFSLEKLTVCFSDLLEGLIWKHMEENQYEP